MEIYFFRNCFRHLASEITSEWEDLSDELNSAQSNSESGAVEVEKLTAKKETLIALCKDIVPYHMTHNAEAEACDLLMEIEQLDLLIDHIDTNVYPRVCLYLTR